MRLFIYNLILILVFPIGIIKISYQYIINRKSKESFIENYFSFIQRLGIYEDINIKQPIWFHAVSLGEVIGSQVIVRSLIKKEKVLLTVSTYTGYCEAKRLHKETIDVVYAPYDFYLFVWKFLRRFQPKAYVIFETELWMTSIHLAHKNNIPIVLTNGRLSSQSYKKYLRNRWLLSRMFKQISFTFTQDRNHIERYIKLGIPQKKIQHVPSVKFDINDIDINTVNDERENIILAASTHPGEDEILVETFLKIHKEFSGYRFIIVPRHPERAENIKNIVKSYGHNVEVSSNISNAVFTVINATGVLNKIYRKSKIAFIGGSLIERGGHNIIEPASNRTPFIIGEHMFNFQEVLNIFKMKKSYIIVSNKIELYNAFKSLIKDKNLRYELVENAFKTVAENKGGSLMQANKILNLMGKFQ